MQTEPYHLHLLTPLSFKKRKEKTTLTLKHITLIPSSVARHFATRQAYHQALDLSPHVQDMELSQRARNPLYTSTVVKGQFHSHSPVRQRKNSKNADLGVQVRRCVKPHNGS